MQGTGLQSHEMFIAVNRANRAFSELLRTCLSHHDLTIPQWGILGHLYTCQQARPSSIATFLGVKAPFVAKTCADLESAGYIESTPFPDDERGKMLRLTATGHNLVETVEPMLQHCIHEQLSDIDQDQLKSYFSLNHHIAHNVHHH